MSKKNQRRALFSKKGKKIKRLQIWILSCVTLIAAIYGLIFLWPAVPSVANMANSKVYTAKIQPRSSLASIAKQLEEQGLSTPSIPFQISAKILFVGSKLKPGTYQFSLNASLGNILLQIARGDRIRESVAIIPGMTIWQLRALVDSHPSLIHQTKGMSSKDLLKDLGLTYPGDEGIFMPDTYVFDPEELDINIYRKASQAMQKQLYQAWAQKSALSPLKSPYDLLILASIVEKETGRSSERGMISAVFTNRLNMGMPLQTDPTVIYGIGPQFNGNLRKTDLRRDNPYNTYMRKGLPPTPIAMPSKESILAAANPAGSDALYFVSKGDGSSHFSKSLGEHEVAVDRYQRKSPSKANPFVVTN